MALWLVLAWGMRFVPAGQEASSHRMPDDATVTPETSGR
jgi:hypothetical protein